MPEVSTLIPQLTPPKQWVPVLLASLAGDWHISVQWSTEKFPSLYNFFLSGSCPLLWKGTLYQKCAGFPSPIHPHSTLPTWVFVTACLLLQMVQHPPIFQVDDTKWNEHQFAVSYFVWGNRSRHVKPSALVGLPSSYFSVLCAIKSITRHHSQAHNNLGAENRRGRQHIQHATYGGVKGERQRNIHQRMDRATGCLMLARAVEGAVILLSEAGLTLNVFPRFLQWSRKPVQPCLLASLYTRIQTVACTAVTVPYRKRWLWYTTYDWAKSPRCP